jgi:hypothetical protein
MRNAHGALYACQEADTIGQLPTSGNSKTAERRTRAANGSLIILDVNGLRARFGGLASRAGPA